LQAQHRMQPNRLDMPADGCRLRFARWLVEHGRISEDMRPDQESQDEKPIHAAPRRGAWPISPQCIPARYWDLQSRHACNHREDSEGGCPTLLRMLCRLRAKCGDVRRFTRA
jgi:hypothetical protein